ncbi:MAG: NapC/NirT family cytochrome c [Proteobacteria bacterium]|nr:NapC/NirT family cytochrome c [Pseudomonadota bacterium]
MAPKNKGWLTRLLPNLACRCSIVFVVGFFVLLCVVGSFNTALDYTNSLEFCVSCHDMQTNYAEYKKSTHYSNKAGVRAICSDCHVPKKDWIAEMRRKAAAANDVWGELIGVINTPEKFEAKRLEMAQREWARMKESDSIGCRNCHSFESMNVEEQEKMAKKRHTQVLLEKTGKTCIDCHKGIVHELPKGQKAAE